MGKYIYSLNNKEQDGKMRTALTETSETRVYDRDPHVKMAEVDMPCKNNGLTIQVIPVKSESECESVREMRIHPNCFASLSNMTLNV